MKNYLQLEYIKKMGIHGLNKFLKNTCPDVYEEIHISEYAFKKVAIDISLYLYLFKARHYDPDNPNDASGWLGSFIKFIECLRKYELHCVFIYDAHGVAHPDKEKERQKRKDDREKLRTRVYHLEEAVERFHESSEVDPLLIEFQNKKMKTKRLLKQNQSIDIKTIEFYIKKLKRQLFTVTPKDFHLTKKLFDILDVPYFEAPLEAETMCSDLCKRNLVDAVLSRDSDVLAYGAPVFLSHIDVTTGVCLRVKYTDLLENLGFISDQFLDFCIMCGTDYNKNIFRVGPKTAYKLMHTHKNIENIELNTKLDTTILNHKRGRELFREYKQANTQIPYCGFPNFQELEKFLVIYNIKIPIDSLKSSFEQNIVIFEEEEEEEKM